MSKRKKRHLPARHQQALQRQQMSPALSEKQKEKILARFKNLKGLTRTFVSEIFSQARKARGRLDEDVYGVLQATMDALQQTKGNPPPLVFGVSHYQTGKVEQVGFMPEGVTELGPGGRFITNHPGLRPPDLIPPGGPPQLRG